jgi:hypothetical protein
MVARKKLAVVFWNTKERQEDLRCIMMYPHSTFKLSVYLLLARVFCAVNAVKINLEEGKNVLILGTVTCIWDFRRGDHRVTQFAVSYVLASPCFRTFPIFSSISRSVCVCVRACRTVYLCTSPRTDCRNIHALFSGLFIGLFVIRRANQALISYVGVLPSCCDLCYTLHAELFLQPHFLPHKEHMLSLSERLS